MLFLGDFITKYKDKITPKSKDTYVDNMLTMLTMEGCKPTDTPMVRRNMQQTEMTSCLKNQRPRHIGQLWAS